jgi:hypothetical protein
MADRTGITVQTLGTSSRERRFLRNLSIAAVAQREAQPVSSRPRSSLMRDGFPQCVEKQKAGTAKRLETEHA